MGWIRCQEICSQKSLSLFLVEDLNQKWQFFYAGTFFTLLALDSKFFWVKNGLISGMLLSPYDERLPHHTAGKSVSGMRRTSIPFADT
jgi:hypothetical protein